MSLSSLLLGLLLLDINPEQPPHSTGLSQMGTAPTIHEGLLYMGQHRKLLGTKAVYSAKEQCADPKLSWITAGCWVSKQYFRAPMLQDTQQAQTSDAGWEPSSSASSSLSLPMWGVRIQEK